MTLAILYAATLAVFLGLDYLGLSYIVRPVFEREIGGLLLDTPKLGAAVLFYTFYIAVMVYFVSWPALRDDRTLLWVFGTAALIGAMGYGTYEFTNLATLKGWSWRMVATDLAWGTLLTAVSASAGVWAARSFG